MNDSGSFLTLQEFIRAGTTEMFRNTLMRLWRCSNGVTSIEYGLMAATIGTITIFTVASVGVKLDTTYRLTAAAISNANSGGSGELDGDSSGSSVAESGVEPPSSSPSASKADEKAAAKADKAAEKAANKSQKSGK